MCAAIRATEYIILVCGQAVHVGIINEVTDATDSNKSSISVVFSLSKCSLHFLVV